MPRAPVRKAQTLLTFQQKGNVIKNRSCQFDARKTGPQEPRRSKPPMATTWAPRPNPMATPMVQNVHPHRDPIVTPVMRNVHPAPSETANWEKHPKRATPLASSAKDWMTCSPRLSALISLTTSPQGDSSYQSFSTYDGTNDPFDHIMHYRQLMTLDIGNDALLCKVFPASLPRTGSLMVSSPTSQLCW
ncbi:hypothetical protein CK203_046658 [Vitis vinifera]|uniref:Uncharacterized protein n=1 Tax=Vitis vinifera TaxID=29760 RepID=A0A438HJY7_VITVI|nr:hypothetical protein CK203_046658 [Vitis vinifera]